MTPRSKWLRSLSVFTLAAAVPLGVTAVSAQPNTLTAKKAAAAPALDGSMDAAWKASPAMTVKGVGG